jgi:hypothetical protein
VGNGEWVKGERETGENEQELSPPAREQTVPSNPAKPSPIPACNPREEIGGLSA